MILNESNFLSNLKKLNCFENNPHISVGVSGGPDSMALVYLLSRWIKLKRGKLSALVFDHGIRIDSKEESHLVKRMLKNLNIEATIIKVKKNKLIKNNMDTARINRFDGLINFCRQNNILHLFLGHHFDDNIETYLIRKINGSNLEGLNSINNISYYNNIQILRPLIETNKLSILDYNKKNKINFINDPSNKDINFTRVKVRSFLKNQVYKKKIRNDFLYLKKQIPNYKKMVWELFINSMVDLNSNKIKIDFKKLIKLDDLLVEKHILIVINFFLNKKNQTKNSKILIFIEALKKPNFKIFNLSGVIIQKKSNFLIFSNK